MSQSTDRRCFLKKALAASAAVYSGLIARVDGQTSKPASLRIGVEANHRSRAKVSNYAQTKSLIWGLV
jgi:hypothetical protein